MGFVVDAVDLTRKLVRQKTVNPPGGESACTRLLGDMLRQAGFTISLHAMEEGRESLVARAGRPGGRALGFTGHVDTVPLGAAPWTLDPLAAEVRDGRLYGRGSSDMKSGVAAFVTAAMNLREHIAEGPGVELVVTVAEETGSEGARHLAETPGALGRVGALVVAEPTGNHPLLGHKGALWLRAVAAGVTAHGSMPEPGINAAYRGGRMLGKLEGFDFGVASHEIMGPPTLNVGTVKAGMNINSVPDRAEIGIDMRTIPGLDHAALHARLHDLLAEELAELEVIVDLPGVWTEPQDPWAGEVFALVRPLLAETPRPKGAAYFTDASYLTAAYGNVPTMILGPGELALAHQTDEYCEVERIMQSVTIYERLIEAWQAVR
jgi:succinyl-diaminopimelate desuccinylase